MTPAFKCYKHTHLLEKRISFSSTLLKPYATEIVTWVLQKVMHDLKLNFQNLNMKIKFEILFCHAYLLHLQVNFLILWKQQC